MKPSNNLRAFLAMLAASEGTSTSPATRNNGYDVIVTGADRIPEIFTDYSTHPFAQGRRSKRINSKGLTSNAAGRYQFMLRDFKHYTALLNLPDFSPASQDKWAMRLIQERGAIALINAGKFDQAVHRCKNIWASLPNAGYGQPEHSIGTLRAIFVANGGTLERE